MGGQGVDAGGVNCSPAIIGREQAQHAGGHALRVIAQCGARVEAAPINARADMLRLAAVPYGGET
jgi:hypothetical protein